MKNVYNLEPWLMYTTSESPSAVLEGLFKAGSLASDL